MKKLTAFFILLFFAYTGFTQGFFRVQAGPVFNYLNAEGNVSFSKMNTGYTLGVAYEMRASENFSVQPELNFTHLKANESINTAEVKFDYIQIPVLLKAVTSKRNLSFYVAPQLGFLIKGTSKSGDKTTNIRDNLTQTDFSGLIGFEYLLPSNITINVRYTQGFSNVYKAAFESPNPTRHQIVGATVGYLFNKKK